MTKPKEQASVNKPTFWGLLFENWPIRGSTKNFPLMPVFIQAINSLSWWCLKENCKYLLYLHWYTLHILDPTTKSKLAFKFQFMWFSGPLDYVCTCILIFIEHETQSTLLGASPFFIQNKSFQFQHSTSNMQSISILLYIRFFIEMSTDSCLLTLRFLTKGRK